MPYRIADTAGSLDFLEDLDMPEGCQCIIQEEAELDDEFAGSQDAFNEDMTCGDPASDLSIDHHPQRKGKYCVIQASEEAPNQDEETGSIESRPWVEIGVDLSEECASHAESCFVKSNPQELSDISVLAMNSVYVFSQDIMSSITRHFGIPDQHHAIIGKLGVFDNFVEPSIKSMMWCVQCSSRSYENWHDIQTLTIGYLSEALSSSNFDLIVANVLHRILPQLKLIGSIREGGEDTYVHDVLAPLLDITFAFNTELGHFWANISLDNAHKQYKPDYGVYANGLSQKFVVLVAEFKHPEGRQRQESDFIKIGKEMRTMLNRLIMIGVHSPVVCGILVGCNRISTFKMELKASQVYAMVQLSDLPLTRNSDDLNLLPLLVANLQQVKEYSLQTAQKIQALNKLIRQGYPSTSSVPTSWLNNNFYSVEKIKNEDTLQ